MGRGNPDGPSFGFEVPEDWLATWIIASLRSGK
jgi:hypothetical protein